MAVVALPTIRDLKGRVTSDYLVDYRNSTKDTYSDWKERIRGVDQVIRGDWTVTYPGEGSKSVKPMVMNLADSVPRDLARLVMESAPSVTATARSDKQDDTLNKDVREAIAQTHWIKNRAPIWTPQLAMDAAITGAMCVVAWAAPDSPYPHLMRVDPRGCYPDMHNGIVQDLLVVQKVKARIADRLYPHLGIMDAIAVHGPRQDRRNPVPGWDDTVEEWSYYSADEVVRAYAAISGDQLVGEDGVWIAEQSRVNLSCPPVAFEQLPSPDGAFRGILDQVGESLMTKNKAVDYLMTYMHQMIYTPFIAQNILNASDPPGPDTIYQVDPTAQNAQMQRVSPATPANQAFGLIQYIDQEQRGQLGYPSARQGEVSQSIASAAFVASTQGQLTSMVRDIQRLIGDLRERASYIAFELDERFLDFEKPLLRPVGKKRTYTPSRDINKQYDVQVTYGAGAGLDRLNTDARLLQLYGSGAISQETVLSNTDFVSEATTEMEKREREEIGRVILQRFAGDPSVSLDFIIEVYRLQRDEGLSLVDAMTKAQEQQAAQPQPQQPGEMAPQPQAQPSAQEQQTAIQKGGTPQAPQGAPAIPGAFSPPPLEQILVRPR